MLRIMVPLSCSSLVVLFLGIALVFSTCDATNQKLIYKTPGVFSTQGNGSLGIYKGKTTTIRKHPYLAGIVYNGVFACDGAIIADDWVLTLGDCVYGADPTLMEVVTGSRDGTTGKSYAVSKVKVHPDYGTAFLDYDYGLLKIKGKFKWSTIVKKARLPKREPKIGSKAIIVGYCTSEDNSTLEEGVMKVISKKECQKKYKDLDLTVTPRISCIYNKGKTSPCGTDLSDIVVEGKSTVTQLFSAVGNSGSCSSQALPAVTADVHAALDWIKTTIKAVDDE